MTPEAYNYLVRKFHSQSLTTLESRELQTATFERVSELEKGILEDNLDRCRLAELETWISQMPKG